MKKRSGGPFLTERQTAKPFGYNSFFDIYFFRGEHRI